MTPKIKSIRERMGALKSLTSEKVGCSLESKPPEPEERCPNCGTTMTWDDDCGVQCSNCGYIEEDNEDEEPDELKVAAAQYEEKLAALNKLGEYAIQRLRHTAELKKLAEAAGLEVL